MRFYWKKRKIKDLDEIMKQEMSKKIETRTGKIPDWVKKGILDWLWIAIIIILSLFSIAIRFDDFF